MSSKAPEPIDKKGGWVIKLPSFKRLFTTDFQPNEQQFAEKIATPVNAGIESLYTLANNNINLGDNIAGSLKTIQISVDSGGFPKSSTAIPLTNTNKVIGTLVLSANNLTKTNVYPTAGVFISGSQNKNTYIINNVAGLTPGDSWQLTVFAFN